MIPFGTGSSGSVGLKWVATVYRAVGRHQGAASLYSVREALLALFYHFIILFSAVVSNNMQCNHFIKISLASARFWWFPKCCRQSRVSPRWTAKYLSASSDSFIYYCSPRLFTFLRFYSSMSSEGIGRSRQKWLISCMCCKYWPSTSWRNEWWPKWTRMTR